MGQMNSEIMGFVFNLRLDDCKRPSSFNQGPQNRLRKPAMSLLSLCLNAIAINKCLLPDSLEMGSHCILRMFSGCRGEQKEATRSDACLPHPLFTRSGNLYQSTSFAPVKTPGQTLHKGKIVEVSSQNSENVCPHNKGTTFLP